MSDTARKPQVPPDDVGWMTELALYQEVDHPGSFADLKRRFFAALTTHNVGYPSFGSGLDNLSDMVIDREERGHLCLRGEVYLLTEAGAKRLAELRSRAHAAGYITKVS